PPQPARRPGQTLAAFVLGLPLAAGLLLLFHAGPLRNSAVFHYVEYPVQWAEVVLFSCALGALLGKFWQLRAEHEACARDILPAPNGTPLPADQAHTLLGSVNRLSGRLRETYLVRRIRGVLDYLTQRRSAAQLDDHLRDLADADFGAMENSYALVRFITWAIPILGFLGTVLGITGAISGVTPEVLEESMSMVTDGLAEAFDATALALGLTMVTMFLTF